MPIAAPWHILAARANPAFLNFYFYHEHWLRFTTRIHGRYEPWWYFVPVLLGGLFPWIFFGGQALRAAVAGGWKTRLKNQQAWFFVIWIGFIFLFFSYSQSKLIPYLLPVFPAAAVLLGKYLTTAPAAKLKPGAWAFLVVFVLMAIAAIVYPAPKNQPDIAASLPLVRAVAAAVLLGGAAAVFTGIRRGSAAWILASISIFTAGFLAVVTCAAGGLEKSSTKRFATILKPKLAAGDRVYSIGFYAQDLPVYLGRLIDVVDYRGELGYGIDAEPDLTSKRFISPDELPARWNQAGRVFAVVRRSDFDEWFSKSGISFEVLSENRKFLLVAKSPPAS
jgi:4-amino-4-deoxy-L-arabinose transferase-like glycosyltransferase